MLQSLQLLPGVSSPSENASDLHIRGGTPDQNLVLWDGIKMYHQGHFFGQISAFNPYVTKEINLHRAGTSVQYGDRISGVLDIRTTDEGPFRCDLWFGFETHNQALELPSGFNGQLEILDYIEKNFTGFGYKWMNSVENAEFTCWERNDTK